MKVRSNLNCHFRNTPFRLKRELKKVIAKMGACV